MIILIKNRDISELSERLFPGFQKLSLLRILRETVPAEFCIGFVRKKELHGIACLQFLRTICSFAVQRDIFLPHHLEQQAVRRFLQMTVQEFVKTLPCFPLSYHNLLHTMTSQ